MRAVLLILTTPLLACGSPRPAGEGAACGIAAVAGPAMVLSELSRANTALPVPPAILPAHAVARFVAGPAASAVLGRRGDSLEVGVDGGVPPGSNVGFGVLVADPSGVVRGVLVYDGVPVGGGARARQPHRRRRSRPPLRDRPRPHPGGGSPLSLLPRLGPPVTLPRIGVSGRVARIEGAERSGVNGAYLRAVARAGGAPVVLSPLAGVDAVPALLDGIDALILSGGADVDPAHYGAPRHPKLGALEPERDAFEFALFAAARARALPTLAICRGLQLANVAMGGTLWQDLPSEKGAHPQSGARNERVHEIEAMEGSRLGDILRSSTHRVNSFHHQAIRDLAPGLAGSARSPDGLLEGVEIFSGWWFVGVQWHPEEFWAEESSSDLALFRALVSEAGVVRA